MTESERLLLAIDAGGSNTRAVLVDRAGVLRGYGVSTSGNPTAVGPNDAMAAIAAAAALAAAQAGVGGETIDRVVLAVAGEQGLLSDAMVRAELGLTSGTIDRVHDILAMYHSAAVEPEGVALVAGTGAIAARFSHLEPEQIVDGTGWLLGDHGSGFWIGRQVAAAAVADLDGSGAATALTALVLADLGVAGVEGCADRGARRRALEAMVSKVYAEKPVRLARFAPYAFAVAASDETAAAIVASAEKALAHTLQVVRDGYDELPVVLGGSVVARGILGGDRPSSGPLVDALAGADVRWVHEGAAGAAVVGLMRSGVCVDAPMLDAMLHAIESARS